MNPKRLAIQGVAFNWLGRCASLAIAIFMTPFLVAMLGDARYGMWAVVQTLTGYYVLADMGLRTAATKYIAEYSAVDDRPAMNRVLVTSLGVYLLVAVLVLILVSIVAVLLPWIANVEPLPASTVRWVAFLTGATVSLRILTQVFSATLAAMHRHDLMNGISVGSQILQAVCIVTALRNDMGLLAMAWVTFGVATVTQCARAAIALRFLHGFSLSPRHYNRDTLKLVIRFGGTTFMTRLARRFAEQSGSMVVFLLMGPAAVPYYAIPESLARKARGIGTGVTSVIDPLASRMDAKGRKDALISLMIIPPRLLLAVSLSIASIFVLMGDSLIELWIGPSYAPKAYPILCLLAGALVLRMATTPLRAVLRGKNYLRPLVISGSAELAITLFGGLFGVWMFGQIGMASAVTVAQFVGGGLIIPLGVCRATGYSVRDLFQNVLVRAILAAAPGAVVAAILAATLTPTRLLHLVPIILSVGAVACVGIFFVGLESAQRHDVFDALLPKRLRPKRAGEVSGSG